MSRLYKVIWRQRLIEVTLAQLVVETMERGESVEPITLAMERIDDLLQNSPETEGESRSPHERVLIVMPLAVDFEIHEEERVVYILGLRYVESRPKG